eukprot:6896634-Pyramimonas_sp.AAC.1
MVKGHHESCRQHFDSNYQGTGHGWARVRQPSHPRTLRGKGGHNGKSEMPVRSKQTKSLLARIVPIPRSVIGVPPQPPWPQVFEEPPVDASFVKDYEKRVYRRMDLIGIIAPSAKEAGKPVNMLIDETTVLKLMAQSRAKFSV